MTNLKNQLEGWGNQHRAFHDHFKKDFKVSDEIGEILSSSFDDKEFKDLTVEEIAGGPPEYSLWNRRN